MSKPFVVDYQISGTLLLHEQDSMLANTRAREIIARAMVELREVSDYCEEDVNSPIDALARYAKPRKRTGGRE